jgi:hypothetical protein
MVTAADILAALRTASVRKVEIAGLTLNVRGLTAAEMLLVQQRAKDGNPMTDPEVVALCVCDEDGKALFSCGQAAELANVDGGSVSAIARQIVAASAAGESAAEDAAKN